MGCHRRLCYARLLNRSGFGFVTVFVPTYVSRFPHYSARSLKKGFSVCFHSVQPLPNSHNKSSFVTQIHQGALVFPFASRRLSELEIFVKRLCKRTSPDCNEMEYRDSSFRSLQPHQHLHLPLVSLHTIPFTSTVQPTASFFHPIQHQQKHVPNPCAYCRGRRLSSPCPFPAFPLTQLAVGSQRSSRSSFHLLHSFRKPTAVHHAALLHAAALKAVFTFFNKLQVKLDDYARIPLLLFTA